MDYVIGDLQGCCDALDRLLDKIGFSASRDRLYALGDLVNRGPESLRTLQRLRALDNAAVCLLGNHDLHLLAVAHGVRQPKRSDTLQAILGHAYRQGWLDWLRQRPLAHQACGWLMVHAGVVPQWTGERTLQLAEEVSQCLRGPDAGDFFQVMYQNDPERWDEGLQGHDRIRFVVNTLTRTRFVRAEDGALDLKTKEAADKAPPGLVAWFDAPGRLTQGLPIAFGHWSTLGLINRPDLLAIDTGCVWGGQLTAVRIDGGRREVTQVHCKQAQRPG